MTTTNALPVAADSRQPCDSETFLDQAVSVDGGRIGVNNVYAFQPGQVIDVHGNGPGFPLFGWVSVTRTGTDQGDGRLDNYDKNVIEVSGAMRINVGDIFMIHDPRHPKRISAVRMRPIEPGKGLK